MLKILSAGSGVQDQLDALAMPSPTSDIESSTAVSPSVTGCQQCMGLSQLSFAASTMTPAAVHSHGPSASMHSLHMVGNHQQGQNLAQHLSTFAGIDNRQGAFPESATLTASLAAERTDVALTGVDNNDVKTEREDGKL